MTLAERMVRALEDEIVSGRQTSGVRLDEQRLADFYGVSRTPVREALRELVATGLVEKRPHRGFIVRHWTQQELSDLFETMALMEASCGRLAAERITNAEIKSLRELMKALDAVVKQADASRYDELNRELHSLIYQSAHNSILVETANSIRRRTAPFRRAQFQLKDRMGKSHAEHKHIIKAIIARDGTAAYENLYAHILSSRDSACDYLNQMSKQLVLGTVISQR